MKVISASVSGEKLSNGEKRKKARKLGIQPRQLSGGQRIRTSVLKSEKSCMNLELVRTNKIVNAQE